jgi:hypothetical protein
MGVGLVARHCEVDMSTGRIQSEGVELGMGDNLSIERSSRPAREARYHADDGDVDVSDPQPKQRVANRATDQVSSGAVYFGYGCNAAQLAQREGVKLRL